MKQCTENIFQILEWNKYWYFIDLKLCIIFIIMYYFLSCFSVKSYIKAKKDKKLSTKEIIDEIRKEKKENGVTKVVAKNVVVSSFTAPAPVAPVVVSPSSTDTSDGVTPSLLDDVIDDVFLFNNLSPAGK